MGTMQVTLHPATVQASDIAAHLGSWLIASQLLLLTMVTVHTDNARLHHARQLGGALNATCSL